MTTPSTYGRGGRVASLSPAQNPLTVKPLVIPFDPLNPEEGQAATPEVEMGDSRSAHVGSREAELPPPIHQVAEAVSDNLANLLSLFHL